LKAWPSLRVRCSADFRRFGEKLDTLAREKCGLLQCCNFDLPWPSAACHLRIVNWNRVTYFGIFLVLFCCTPARLKSGGNGEYAESRYRVFSGTAATERRFEQIMEQRDIKLATNTLLGEGFTAREIQDAVQNRYLRIGTWPGHYCSASGTIGEPGEGTVVGPNYYLIVGRARILRWFRQTDNYN